MGLLPIPAPKLTQGASRAGFWRAAALYDKRLPPPSFMLPHVRPVHASWAPPRCWETEHPPACCTAWWSVVHGGHEPIPGPVGPCQAIPCRDAVLREERER